MSVPNLSLKTSQYNPIVYTPTQYVAQTSDLSILERSLSQREARMKEATQQRSALDMALGNIESQLNPAEHNWFNNYKRNINQQIQNSVDLGDFGNAIRTATSLAGTTAKDSAILSRIDANKKYQDWRTNLQSRLDKGEISQDIARWAIEKNPYEFTETRDMFGNVVGGKLTAPKQVYNKIDWGEIAAKAAAFNRPDVIGSESGGENTGPAQYDASNGGIKAINGQLGQGSNSWKSGSQFEQVTSDEIFNTIGNMLNIPELKQQAIQDYEVSVWNYQKQLADGILNDTDYRNLIEQGLVQNGSIIPLQQYLNEKANLFKDALAYKKRTTSSFKGNGFALDTKNGTSGSGGDNSNEETPSPQPGGRGNNVQMKGWYNISNGAFAAGDALDDQLIDDQSNN